MAKTRRFSPDGQQARVNGPDEIRTRDLQLSKTQSSVPEELANCRAWHDIFARACHIRRASGEQPALRTQCRSNQLSYGPTALL